MFELSNLSEYDNILLQCHDDPDADTLSCAFAVYSYLKKNGKSVRILYSGYRPVSKSNLRLMINSLGIPAEHIQEIKKAETLVLLDCQYGEGNVMRIDADNIFIIDHHPRIKENSVIRNGIINPDLGSCATLVWSLLRNENFDFSENRDVATALYYGLYTDTDNYAEINHPLDKDMRDDLHKYCDHNMINRLRFCNLSIDELEIAGVALLRNKTNKSERYAIFKAEMCDPNILGFISDLGVQVDNVDVCVVYSQRENGVKISVRSCTNLVMAFEFARFVTRGVGTGGGHKDKAGGYIHKEEIDALRLSVDDYIKQKTDEYFSGYDVIDAADHSIDVTSMRRYKKKPIPNGYVISSEVFPEGTPLLIRTLEGDSNIRIDADTYFMIGIHGEVRPIKADKFHKYYSVCEKQPDIDDSIYTPTVKNVLTGEIKGLIPYMKSCMPQQSEPIYAKELTGDTKVFTEWYPNGYLYGSEGDYLTVRCDDLNDVYVIARDIFFRTYEPMD